MIFHPKEESKEGALRWLRHTNPSRVLSMGSQRSAVIMFLCFMGCGPKTVIRDRNVYESEVNQYHKWATSQAAHLRSFVGSHCKCVGDRFESEECEKATDLVLTVEARAGWHRDMSLWNAGITTEEPSQVPPAIPALSCPIPPQTGRD